MASGSGLLDWAQQSFEFWRILEDDSQLMMYLMQRPYFIISRKLRTYTQGQLFEGKLNSAFSFLKSLVKMHSFLLIFADDLSDILIILTSFLIDLLLNTKIAEKN